MSGVSVAVVGVALRVGGLPALTLAGGSVGVALPTDPTADPAASAGTGAEAAPSGTLAPTGTSAPGGGMSTAATGAAGHATATTGSGATGSGAAGGTAATPGSRTARVPTASVPAGGSAASAGKRRPAPAPSPARPVTPTTVTGASAGTPYGAVQVRLTISGGRILAAQAIDYPHDNGRDQMINGMAIPQLNAEVVRAQNAGIDAVSGASFTSAAYRQSLQSALDAAHLR